MSAPRWEPPMVIDFHSHLAEPGSEKFARQQGFDRTVVFAGPTNHARVLEFCQASEGRFIPYGWLDMSDAARACDQARSFKERGFRGIKFQPMLQRFRPEDEALAPLWKTLEALNLPLTSHAGSTGLGHHLANFANPSGWAQVAEDHPGLRIVIAHMGGNYTYEALTMAEAFPNVYLDTANLDYYSARSLPRVSSVEVVERAVRFAGAGKVIFASEGMTPDLIYRSDAISRNDRKRIFWKNALEVLGEPDV